jgi:hypothetical protein
LQTTQKYLLSAITNFEKRIKRNEVFDAISDKVSKMERVEFCEALSKSIKDKKIAGFEIIRGPYGGVRLVDIASAKLTLSHSELAAKADAAPTEEVVVQEDEDATAEAELLKMKGLVSNQDKKSQLKPKIESKPESVLLEEKPYLQSRPLTTISSFKWLWINDSRYYVQMATSVIERFIVNVMRAKIDSEGSIVFNGKKYFGDEQLLHRFLTEFIGARADVSPPLLETADINGVPIHLIDEVNKSPTPQALAEWNKKQQLNGA